DAYIHVSTASNLSALETFFDYPGLNDNPAARFLLTKQLDAEGATNGRDTGLIYVAYSGAMPQRWSTYTAQGQHPGTDEAWNVFIPPAADVILHTSSPSDGSTRAYIESSLFDNDPSAMLFIQPVVNPGGGGGIVASDALAVTYDPQVGRWAIVNADGLPMGTGLHNFVWRAGPGGSDVVFRQTSTAANHLISDGTVIDNPVTNGQPDAL